MSDAPYIGMTGVVYREDVDAAALCARLLPPSHRLMAGVLASAKTLRGEDTTNRRYPFFDRVEPLLSALDDAGAWPVVHFNCRDNLAVCLDLLASDLPSMRGLQLNVVRPDLGAVERFLRARPDVAFILQVNRGIVAPGAPITAEAVAAYVERYAGVATYALVDLSGGEGRPLDVALAVDVLSHWSPAWCVRPAFAGGLGPDAAETMRALCGHVGCDPATLSFDAESRLRVPCADPIPGERYQDVLDAALARRWVACAAAAIGGAS